MFPVGRYITSSLRHIRASANPDKRHAREHYGQIRTPLRFNVDDRYVFFEFAICNTQIIIIMINKSTKDISFDFSTNSLST